MQRMTRKKDGKGEKKCPNEGRVRIVRKGMKGL